MVQPYLGSRALGGQQGMTIYVNFFIHSEDFISVESQHATQRAAELFARHGLKADFYLTGLVAERMMTDAPETIDTLRRTRMPISYHADIHAPFPTLPQRVCNMSWDEAVAETVLQETHHLDPLTGELTEDRPNQMALLTEIFGRPPLVTIGAVAGQGAQAIRHAQHQLGVPMASTNGSMLSLSLVWHNGMLRGLPSPNSYFYLIERFVRPDRGKPMRVDQSADQVVAILDRQVEQIPRGEDSILSVGVHDFTFALTDGWIGCYIDRETHQRRNPSLLWASPPLPAFEQERIWRVYESVVAYCAQHPDIEIITAEDVLGWVEPLPETQTLSGSEVLAVAEGVLERWAGPGYPPAHVKVGGRELSLADCFQALVHALASYRRQGSLPETVVIRELVGPTDTPVTLAIKQGEFQSCWLLGGEKVADLAAAVETKMTDRIPGVVDLTGGERPVPSLLAFGQPPSQTEGLMNPAEFLYTAAQVVQSLGRTGEPGRALVTGANLLPQPAVLRRTEGRWPPFSAPQEDYSAQEWLADLQTWTVKTALFRR